MAARSRFLHFGFAYPDVFDIKVLEKVFNTAPDWIRYTPTCWIVYTALDSEAWLTKIRAAIGEDKMKDYSFLICEMNLNERQGWLKPWIWEWMRATR